MKTRKDTKSMKIGIRTAHFLFVLFLSFAVNLQAADWRVALPGWKYEFPRDHHAHPDFKTEWWYFTGRVADEKGGIYGYQLTFFRQGLRPPADGVAATSRFVVADVKFAHFALSDIGGQRFHFQQKLSRGAFGEAGFGGDERLAWIDDWSLVLLPSGGFELSAKNDKAALKLKLENAKPFVVHGENGVSQKATGEGRASHYYSATRLKAEGSVTLDGRTRAVTGESWLDREWASNQLTPEQIGWNWFSVQFDDGTELMLYQMRTRDGGLDPNSSGTFIDRAGQSQYLRVGDYQLTPMKYWTSKATGGRYPIAWRLEVPKLNLRATIDTPLPDQELVLQPVAYWEGLIEVAGQRNGAALRGHGYMELTGYAGALVGLTQEVR